MVEEGRELETLVISFSRRLAQSAGPLPSTTVAQERSTWPLSFDRVRWSHREGRNRLHGSEGRLGPSVGIRYSKKSEGPGI